MANGEPAQRSKKIPIMPYDFRRNSLEISIDTVEIDGEEDDSGLNKSQRKIDLDHERFEELKLEGTIDIDQGTVAGVIPGDELNEMPAKLVIAARAPYIFSREIIHSSNVDLDTESVEFSHKFRRENFGGRVDLIPFLVRATQAPESVRSNYASHPGAKLANGLKWRVFFDKREGPGVDKLDIRWKSFEDTERIGAGDEALFFLECNREYPRLFLNIDKEKLLFNNLHGSNRGRSGRIKESIFDYIYLGVYVQLFIRAVEDIDDEYNTRWDWEDSVLDYFIPELFPRTDAEEALRRLKERHSDGDISGYITTVISKLQEDETVKTDMKRLVREVTDTE